MTPSISIITQQPTYEPIVENSLQKIKDKCQTRWSTFTTYLENHLPSEKYEQMLLSIKDVFASEISGLQGASTYEIEQNFYERVEVVVLPKLMQVAQEDINELTNDDNAPEIVAVFINLLSQERFYELACKENIQTDCHLFEELGKCYIDLGITYQRTKWLIKGSYIFCKSTEEITSRWERSEAIYNKLTILLEESLIQTAEILSRHIPTEYHQSQIKKLIANKWIEQNMYQNAMDTARSIPHPFIRSFCLSDLGEKFLSLDEVSFAENAACQIYERGTRNRFLQHLFSYYLEKGNINAARTFLVRECADPEMPFVINFLEKEARKNHNHERVEQITSLANELRESVARSLRPSV